MIALKTGRLTDFVNIHMYFRNGVSRFMCSQIISWQQDVWTRRTFTITAFLWNAVNKNQTG